MQFRQQTLYIARLSNIIKSAHLTGGLISLCTGLYVSTEHFEISSVYQHKLHLRASNCQHSALESALSKSVGLFRAALPAPSVASLRHPAPMRFLEHIPGTCLRGQIYTDPQPQPCPRHRPSQNLRRENSPDFGLVVDSPSHGPPAAAARHHYHDA